MKIGFPVLISRGIMVIWGLFSILIIRILPEDTFAAYALARSIQLFAVVLGGGFIMQAIVKYTAENDTDREKKIANAGMLLSAGMALLVAIILIAGGGVLQSFYADIDLTGIPTILAILVVTSTASMIPRNLLIARHRTKYIMYADIASITVRICIVTGFIVTNSLTSPLQVFSALIAGNIMALIVNAIFARDLIRLSLGFDKTHLRMLTGFAAVSLGAGLADIIYSRTDILLLGKLSDDIQVAGYAACRTLTVLLVNLNVAAKIVLLPLISRMWSQNQRKEIVRRVMSAILIINLIQVPVIILFTGFPKDVLNFLYKGKYNGTWDVLLVLGLLALVRPFGSMFSTMAIGMGKPSFALHSLLVSTFINVLLNIILIPSYGAFGAAIATVVAVILGSALVTILTVRYWRGNQSSNTVSER